MKRVKRMIGMAAMICCFFHIPEYAMAAENVIGDTENMTIEGTVSTEGDYTVIRINVQDNSNGPLLYAIDSDAPEAFGSNNEFTVIKGSEHTVYVKDVSGNITAQTYKVPDTDVDLEVSIGYSDTSSASMKTDAEIEAIEKGGGTVAEQVITDGSNDSERLFYTVTTKDEHVFYLMIDQSRSDNNVYLLDQVTDDDLYALAAGDEESKQKEKETLIFDSEPSADIATSQTPVTQTASAGDWFLWVVLILLAVAAIYYYKIYKPKQQKLNTLSDAMDLDEFEAEDEEEDEILDFAVSQEEKEELLRKIMENQQEPEDMEEELNYDPEEDFIMEEETQQDFEEAGDDEAIEELELDEEEDDE